jgi:hypothetical protein
MSSLQIQLHKVHSEKTLWRLIEKCCASPMSLRHLMAPQLIPMRQTIRWWHTWRRLQRLLVHRLSFTWSM